MNIAADPLERENAAENFSAVSLGLRLTGLLLLQPFKKRTKTMLADPIVSKYIAKSCRGSNSRRNTSAHSNVLAITRIRTDDLLLAIPRYSARSIGYLQLLADISASSGIPINRISAMVVNIRPSDGTAVSLEDIFGA